MTVHMDTVRDSGKTLLLNMSSLCLLTYVLPCISLFPLHTDDIRLILQPHIYQAADGNPEAGLLRCTRVGGTGQATECQHKQRQFIPKRTTEALEGIW